MLAYCWKDDRVGLEITVMKIRTSSHRRYFVFSFLLLALKPYTPKGKKSKNNNNLIYKAPVCRMTSVAHQWPYTHPHQTGMVCCRNCRTILAELILLLGKCILLYFALQLMLHCIAVLSLADILHTIPPRTQSDNQAFSFLSLQEISFLAQIMPVSRSSHKFAIFQL